MGELQKVAVIGAGLAGAACAAVLARAGFEVHVYDRSEAAACGASGVPLALFSPNVSADDALHSRMLRGGVHVLHGELLRLTQQGALVASEDWALTGLTERLNLDPARRAIRRLPPQWSAPVDPPQLQSRLGEEVHTLEHPYAGWVNPRRLIAAWLAHAQITFIGNTALTAAEVLSLRRQYAHVVVCAGHHTASLLDVQLQSLRGQVQYGALAALGHVASLLPAKPVGGLGHFVKGAQTWLVGASFLRDDTQGAASGQETGRNFEKLQVLCPQLDLSALWAMRAHSQAWVGTRAVTPNRLPVVAEMSPGVWVCSGLGSRGLSWALLCAQRIGSALQSCP